MTSAGELRTRAEDLMRMTQGDVGKVPNQNVQRLVYELQVHQIELEMQNESLRFAQRDIEKSREQYQELFDCAPAAYLMLDATGSVVRANTAALMLMGVPLPRVVGQPLAGFIAHEDVSVLRDHLENAQWNTHDACELRLKSVSGVHVHVRMETSVLPSETADCLIVLTDVTERKHSQEALERLNQELEARVAARTAELEMRNRELEAEMLARARSEAQRRALEIQLREVERLRSMGLLAAGVAHDFNNLLVSILGNSDLMLLAAGLPAQFRDPLAQIKHAARRAADLTRQLLVFAGRGRPSMAALNLPLLVADSLESQRARLSERIQFQTMVSTNVPPIEADRSQLHQLVNCLLINAIEAIEGRGSVVVKTAAAFLDAGALADFQHNIGAEPGEFVILQVVDTGCGIDASSLPRICDPFYTTKFTGRGLGLATVLGIVQSHHGAIRVSAPAAGGTSFEVAFPVAAVRRDSERPRESSASASVAAGSVLLIDDDDAVRAVMAQLLRTLGFRVTAANGGKEGLELFQNAAAPFDLVVLDWLMPGVSGEQVLKALRELDPALPMILISGYCAEDLAVYDERVIRLQKPMTLSQLQQAVQMVAGARVSDVLPRN